MSRSFEKLQTTKGRVALSKSSIYIKIKEGTFPKPVKLGKRSVGFVVDEVDEWIEQRIAESRQNEEVRS